VSSRIRKSFDTCFSDPHQLLSTHHRLKAYCSAKADVNCLYFDTYALFDDIVQNPTNYGFISGTEYCTAYASVGGTDPSYVQTDPCEPLPSYFWHDSLHPTWPGHKILAEKVSELLEQM